VVVVNEHLFPYGIFVVVANSAAEALLRPEQIVLLKRYAVFSQKRSIGMPIFVVVVPLFCSLVDSVFVLFVVSALLFSALIWIFHHPFFEFFQFSQPRFRCW
jgi:hypothetical protein